MMARAQHTISSDKVTANSADEWVKIGPAIPEAVFDVYEATGSLPRDLVGKRASEGTLARTELLPEPIAVQDLSAQHAKLETEVAELRAEVRRVKDALVSQRFVAENGYLIRVYRGPEDGFFVAACDTLHCVAEGDNPEEVIEVARGQVRDMLQFLADEDMPIPPRDINGCP